MSERLAGRNAIVTGGASGIGAAVAQAFLREGARVIVADLDGDQAVSRARALADGSDRALGIRVDVTQPASVEEMVEECRRSFGPVDILNTCAGIIRPALIHKMSETDFDDVVNVHLKGSYLCLRAVVGEWIERESGCFIGVISPAATEGQIGGSNYAAAKAGVIGLVKTAALELGRYSVRINAIQPIAQTPMTQHLVDNKELGEKFLRNIPMRRWGKPEEIAEGVVYLASDAASYVTGVILPIDGGRTI